MRKIILLLAAVVCIQCNNRKEKIPPITTMEGSSKVVIYQIMTRLFGNKQIPQKQYGTIQENGVGKFNDINDAALKSIKDLGITHVWYTGVLEHATLSDNTRYGISLDDADVVKGRAGSPFAIKDYYDVDPDLAVDVLKRMTEFEQLVERTHKQDLKVIIDFVPNHVARSYKSDMKPEHVKDFGEDDDNTFSFNPKNNFYYIPGKAFNVPHGFLPLGKGGAFATLDGKFLENPAKVTGNDAFTESPGIDDWFETVKLNYGIDVQNGKNIHFDPIPNTWIKMKEILLYWTSKKVDGFRCDMAEMVPVEFWNWVIPEIKLVNPNVIFIAEIYNPAEYKNFLEKGHFNFLYDKVQLYDGLRKLLTNKTTSKEIIDIQKNLAFHDRHMLHFMENHDEQRVASPQFLGDPWKVVPAMVVSATIDKGPVMIYFGQEVGEPASGAQGFSGDDGRTTIFDYWNVPELQKWMNNGKFNGDALSNEQKQLRVFYSELLNLAGSNTAITQGDFIDLTESNSTMGNFSDKVLAYIRHKDDEKLLVVANFDSKQSSVKINIPPSVASTIGLEPSTTYLGRDLLVERLDITVTNLTCELILKPYSAYVFKIK